MRTPVRTSRFSQWLFTVDRGKSIGVLSQLFALVNGCERSPRRLVGGGGHRASSDYGSEGWGFESLRARKTESPVTSLQGFEARRASLPGIHQESIAGPSSPHRRNGHCARAARSGCRLTLTTTLLRCIDLTRAARAGRRIIAAMIWPSPRRTARESGGDERFPEHLSWDVARIGRRAVEHVQVGDDDVAWVASQFDDVDRDALDVVALADH